MLQLQNIDKLIGVNIMDWQCVNVSGVDNSYLISFRHIRSTTFTAEFLLNREDSNLRGIYKVNGMLYESTGFSNVIIGNFDMHVTRIELQTPMEFVRVLTQPLRVFEKDVEIHNQRKMFNTSSFASNKFVGRGAPTSLLSTPISSLPPVSNGTPDWYVEEPKKLSRWERIKSKVLDILFPIKETIADIKPKPKLRAKKAAY